MAKAGIPDPLERRHLLERELQPAEALRTAQAYLAAERRVEALPFLHRAQAEDELNDQRRYAVAQGDAFLLRALALITGRESPREDWERLAENAADAGKERYAELARRVAAREED